MRWRISSIRHGRPGSRTRASTSHVPSWWHAAHVPDRWCSHPSVRISTIEQSDRGLGRRNVVEELRWELLGLRLDVVLLGLSGEHTLGLIAVTFSLSVLLEGVLY